MGNLKIFTIYDSAVKAHRHQMFFETSEAAIRAFGVAVNDEKTEFCLHPADFTLFEVAELDRSTGKVIPCPPHSLGNALQFKRKPEGTMPLFDQEKVS